MRNTIRVTGHHMIIFLLAVILFDSRLMRAQEKQEIPRRVGVITATSLNVRAKPTTKSEVVCQMVKDALVEVVDEDDEWLGIVAPKETEAWVAMNQLKDGVVVGNNIPVYAGAGTIFSSLGLLQEGDPVTIIDTKDNKWAKIQPTADMIVWISSKYVRVEEINDPPTMSVITDQETDEDVPITGIQVDIDEGTYKFEDIQIVTLTASSSNPAVIPNEKIVIDFTDDKSDAGMAYISITPAAQQSGSSTITLTANDGTHSVENSFNVTVNRVNDPPVISAIGDQTVSEDGTLTSISFNVDEGGGADEDEQTVTLTATSSNHDLVPDASIMLNFSDAKGAAGNGSLSITPLPQQNGKTTITLTANDGMESTKSSFVLTVLAVDDPPTLSTIPDKVINEDESIVDMVFYVDEGGGADEDNQNLRITAISSNTTLLPNQNINITYQDGVGNRQPAMLQLTPAADQNGATTITINVSDGANSLSQSFALTVIPINDPPTISEIPDFTLEEDQDIKNITFTADEGGGSDEDSQALIITAASSNPELIGSDQIELKFFDDTSDAKGGTINITPRENASGTATITLTVNDGINSIEQRFMVSLNESNDPPSLSEIGNQTTKEDTTLSGIKFITDEGGGKSEEDQLLTITATSSNTTLIPNANIKVNFVDNTAMVKGGTIDITPAPDQNGASTITVTVSDQIATTQKTFSVTVTPVNDPPGISQIQDQRTDEDKAIREIFFTADEGGGADEDVEKLTITASSSNPILVPNGNITIDFTDGPEDAGNGAIQIIPAPDQNGSATITVTVSDGEKSSTSRFNLIVTPVNDPPAITEIPDQTVAENSTIDGIIFYVDEGGGSDEDTQIVTVTAKSSNTTLIPNENIRIHLADTTGDPPPGSISITPAPNQNGVSTIYLTISDGTLTAQSRFDINVTGVNSIPTISKIPDQSGYEDSRITGIAFTTDEGGGSDEDIQILKVTAASSNTTLIPNENIYIDFKDNEKDATGGTISIQPAPDLNGTAVITVTVDDGANTASDSFKLTIQPVNDPPIISDIPNQTTQESTTIATISFTVDPGGGADESQQPITITASSSNPTLVPDANIRVNYPVRGQTGNRGTLSITPAAGENGVTTITVIVNDGGSLAQDSFILTVTDDNNPPELSDFSAQTTNEDTPIIGIAFTVDEGGGIDENTQIVTIRATSSNPLLIPDKNIVILFKDDERDATGGTLNITPMSNQFGETIITVSANDGAATIEKSFKVTVNPVNDSPTIGKIKDQHSTEGNPLIGIPFEVDEGGGADEDQQILEVTARSANTTLLPDQNITVNFSDDDTDAVGGTLDITLPPGINGSTIITVTVNDGVSLAQEKFKLNVTTYDDPPTLSTIADQEIDEDTWIKDLAFTADEGGSSDEDTQMITVKALSSNPYLIPNENIIVHFTDTNTDATGGSLELKPVQNESGFAIITVSVSDGNSTIEKYFKVTVRDVDDPPTISPIADQNTHEDIPLIGIRFTADEGGAANEDEQIVKITAVSSNPDLLPNENIVIHFTDDNTAAGAGTIDLTPAPNRNGSVTITLTADDGKNTNQTSFVLKVKPIDDTPLLDDISDQMTDEDTPLLGLRIRADEGGGSDEDIQVLIISAASSNTQLVPTNNIIIHLKDDSSNAGTGNVDLIPAPNENGTTIITLTVNDGNQSVQKSFKFTVVAINDSPTISPITDRVIEEDGILTKVTFTADEGGGPDEDKQVLRVTASSSNPELVPDANILMDFTDADGGNPQSGSLTITPLPNQFGVTTITLKVDDGKASAQTTFVLTVSSINDPPELSAIANKSYNEDTARIIIEFTADEGGGDDEDPQNVRISASSSNPRLIPNENIKVIFSDGPGDAGAGSLEMIPLTNENGTTTITLSVTDGENTIQRKFNVTIDSSNDAPEAMAQSLNTSEDTPVNGRFLGADLDGDPLNFKVQNRPGRGTLTIADTVAGTFTYTPDPNGVGNDEFTFVANDGSEDSLPATVRIAITPVNDAPIILNLKDLDMDEDGILADIAFSVDEGGGDDEDNQILSVTATSSNQALLPDANITIIFTDDENNARPGSLTIKPAADQVGTAKITLTVNDGLLSASKSFNLTVKPVNDPPTLSAIQDYTTDEDITLSGITFATDEGGGPDEDAQELKITLTSSDQTVVPDANLQLEYSDGKLNAGTGKLSITPAADQIGTTRITLTLSDGLSSTSKSFMFTVKPVNDPPTLTDITAVTILEGAVVPEIEFSVDEGGGSDEDSQNLVVSAVSSDHHILPDNGIRINFSDGASDAGRGTLTLTPVQGEFGATDITLTVSDGALSISKSFNFTVTYVNNPPTLTAFKDMTTDEDLPINGITFNADEGGNANEDAQSVVITAVSSNKTLVPDANIAINFSDAGEDAGDGTIDITPAANEFGKTEIVITADDGFSKVQSKFMLTVNAVDDPPVISDIPNQSTNEDTPINNIKFSVDEGGGRDEDQQTVRIGIISSNTTLLPNDGIILHFADAAGDAGDAILDLIPALNQTGTATVTVTAFDGSTRTHKEFLFKVLPQNDPPIAAELAFDATEDTPLKGKVNASDPDGDKLDYQISVAPGYGVVSLDAASGAFTYTPTADYNGVDHFTYFAADTEISSAPAQVTITVKAVNDPPFIAPIAAQKIEEDGTLNNLEFEIDEGGGADEDNQFLRLTATSSNQQLVPNDQISISGGSGLQDATIAILSLKPVADASGATTITVIADDGEVTSEQQFQLTVLPVNDPPTISKISDKKILEDTVVDKFSFQVDEGGGPDEDVQIVTVNVTCSNLELIPAGNIILAFADGIEDADGGTLVMTPAANGFGTATLTVTVSDGVNSASSSFNVIVSAVNDPPVVTDDVLTCQEDTEASGILKASDVDNDPLSFEIVSPPTRGTIKLVSPTVGHFQYQPDADFNGKDSFTYRAGDGTSQANIGTISITVLPMNDPPTISTIPPQSTSEDTPIDNIPFTVFEGGGADEKTQILKVTAVSSLPSLVSNKNIKINFSDDQEAAKGGTIAITPAPNQSGTATIIVTVTDGELSQKTEFDLTVDPVNDPPVVSTIEDQFMNEDETLKGITFFVDEGGGDDENTQIITVTASSSNPALVPQHGIVIAFTDDEGNAPGGTIDITPNPNANGKTTITLAVYDGFTSTNKSFNVTVKPVNDPSVVSDYTMTVEEDTPSTSIFRVTDIDEDPLTFILVKQPVKGKIVITDPATGTFTYTPAPNATGADGFAFKANDGTAESNVAQVTINIVPVNDPPTVETIADVSGDEDTIISGITFAIDEGGGPEEDTQIVTVSAVSDNEKLIANNAIKVMVKDDTGDATSATLSLAPAQDEIGAVRITVTVSDGQESVSTSFNVTIKPVNDPPTIAAIPDQKTDEDKTLSGIIFKVDEGGKSDEDQQALSVTATSSNPSLVPDANIHIDFHDDTGNASGGAIDIIPLPSQSGRTTITVTVSDGLLTASTTFTLTVSEVNNLPVIGAIADQTVNENQILEDIKFTVDEGGGREEDAQKVTIRAKSSNPKLIPDTSVKFDFYDSLGDAEGGTFSIFPAENQIGSAIITLIVDDGLATAETSFTVNVVGKNNPPTIADLVNQKTRKNTPIKGIPLIVDEGGGPDEDNQIITIKATSSNPQLIPVENIIINFTDDNTNAKRGTIDITPANNQIGKSVIGIMVSDGMTTVRNNFNVEVGAVNDSPSAFDWKITTDAGIPTTSILQASDPEDNPLVYKIIAQPVKGTVNIVDPSAGAFVYTPNANASGTDIFTFIVNDGKNDSNVGTVEIIIRNTN